MITVEGLGERGEVWVSWQVPPFDTAGCPTSITASCRITEDVSPVIPCAFYLPPVSSAPFDVSSSPYGSRRTRIDVGAINSIEGNRVTPNPCDQTTVSGTCMNLGPGLNGYPIHRILTATDPYGGPYYHTNGVRISFLTGKVQSDTDRLAYDHRGVLAIAPRTSETQRMWSTWTSLYPDCIPGLVSSSTRPYARVCHSDWFWTKMPTEGILTPTRGTKHTWRHVSANIWLEEWWQEYHYNGGYIPKSPYSWSGYGFVNACVYRRRTHTLKLVWQKSTRFFVGTFACDEEVEYWGHTPSFPKANYFSGSGSGSTTYTATLLVMDPGLCCTGAADLSELDKYCQLAKVRAAELYDTKSMDIARANAIADTTGLESNWIENLSQVGGTLDCVKPLLDGWKAVKHGDFMAAKRALSGAYLVWKYSIAPTLSDAGDIKNNLGKTVHNIQYNRLSPERRRGAFHLKCPVLNVTASLDYYCTFNLVLKDNAFAAVWSALEKMGLDPSTANLWDLVPYSFVVDWFIKVGPALDRLSQYDSAVLIRDCKSRIQSYKVQWPITEDECRSLLPATLQACGPLTYSWYDRRISNRIGSIDPFAGQSITSGLSVSQTTQGLALLSNYIGR